MSTGSTRDWATEICHHSDCNGLTKGESHRGCRPRTAHTASLKYPGFYAMLQNIAPRRSNEATW